MQFFKKILAPVLALAVCLSMFAGVTAFAAGENLALGKSATTSSNYDSGKPGERALDGDTSTYWQANGDQQKNLSEAFISIDLGSAKEFRSIIVKYGSGACIAGKITISYSSNGSSWTKATTANANGTGSEDYINFNAVTARYVKMSFNDSSSHNGNEVKLWPEVTEVEVYNKVSQKEYGESVLNPEIATILGKPTFEKHKGEDTATFTYGASGFTVNFTGTKLEMYVPEYINDRDVTVGVLVDTDMPMEAKMMTVKEGWMTIASGLSNGKHTVTVRKQSRGFYGIMASDWFCVSGLRTDGEFLAPNEKSDFVIEVYGDSITNGDAVWYNANRSNSAWTYGSYSSVVGRLLGAESKICGNTGNGLLGWVMAEKNGKLDNLLPPQNSWNKIDPQHNGSPYYHDGENAADVVIINLGTNDRGELGNGDMTPAMFENEYIRFAKEIKTDCPEAIVIATVGAMGDIKGSNYEVDFDRIVNECNAWAGETFCYYVHLQKCDTIGRNEMVQSYKDGSLTNIPAGAGYDNGHPSNLAHEIYGLQLATLINEVLDLGIDLPDDIPAESFKARTGKDAPNRNLIEYLTGRTDTLSSVYDAIDKANKVNELVVSKSAAQLSTDGSTLRVIAAVDAGKATDGVYTKFANIGFEITVTDKTNGTAKKILKDTLVYDSINDLTAADLRIEGGKLFTLTVTNVPGDCEIEVLAFAVKPDGSRVYGNGGHATKLKMSGGVLSARY